MCQQNHIREMHVEIRNGYNAINMGISCCHYYCENGYQALAKEGQTNKKKHKRREKTIDQCELNLIMELGIKCNCGDSTLRSLLFFFYLVELNNIVMSV